MPANAGAHRLVAVLPLTALVVATLILGVVYPARVDALPSFARQTGLGCPACHSGYPELTPYGRQFKLGGYTDGTWKVPLAGMAQGSFTNTDKGQPGGAAPGFGSNDNFALDALSFFYGGKIFGKLGAFVQGTYSGVDDNWFLDNTDIRFANKAKLGSTDLLYGLTLNNNPTVQDVWNTTPAWGYPYASSSLAPTPAASPLIQGGLAGQVVGLTGYTLWNDLVYVEGGVYHTLPEHIQTRLGIEPAGENQIDLAAPYWRVALQHTFGGKHYAEVGTFGLLAHTFPGRDDSAGHDVLTDIGFDFEYQFLGDPHLVTILTTAIREHQDWHASSRLGLTNNTSDVLWRFQTGVGYMYDRTYGARLTYFLLDGDRDTGLYAPNPIDGSRTGSPKSDGLIAEITWYPLNKHPWSVYPWLNIRFSLQYVAYFTFNGATHNYDGFGRNAKDNNTIYLLGWLAF